MPLLEQQAENMVEQKKKRRLLSPALSTALGVAVILLVTILALRYAPPEGEANNTSGDLPATPTVVVTNLVSSIDIQRQIVYRGVNLSLKKAMLATKFSNDHKRSGNYTLRVLVDTKNSGQDVVGIDYASLVRLVLPDGKTVATKLISVKSIELPDHPQSGFFDFPLATDQVSLAQLQLCFADGPVVPFHASS